MTYKPRKGEPRTYHASIHDDGSLSVHDKVFSSPSYAALYGMQDAGSDRSTVNGWRVWKTEDGKSLFDIRSGYMENG